MAINGKGHDRQGNRRVVVSKRWPDGSRFRRYVPNVTVGKKIFARIEEGIAMGTWRALKEELQHETDNEGNVAHMAPNSAFCPSEFTKQKTNVGSHSISKLTFR